MPLEKMGIILAVLVEQFPNFGGVMGWEYFNSLPGGREKPWQWAAIMSLSMHMKDVVVAARQVLSTGPMADQLANAFRNMMRPR